MNSELPVSTCGDRVVGDSQVRIEDVRLATPEPSADTGQVKLGFIGAPPSAQLPDNWMGGARLDIDETIRRQRRRRHQHPVPG